MFEHKCSVYVNAKHTLDNDEIKKLGMKDVESYPSLYNELGGYPAFPWQYVGQLIYI